MSSLNKALLIGNLGRDAELKFTVSGFAIARFSLATTDRRKNKAGDYEDVTEWHRVTVLGKQAESLSDYLKKGKQVYVEGRIETRSWEKDGEKKYSTEIVADRIQLLGGGERRERSASNNDDYDYGGGSTASTSAGGSVDDDIPFAWVLPFLLPAAGALHVLSQVAA